MEFTRNEIETADLVVVVDPEGAYRWTSHRSDGEVAVMLEAIAEKIRRRRGVKNLEAQQTS